MANTFKSDSLIESDVKGSQLLSKDGVIAEIFNRLPVVKVIQNRLQEVYFLYKPQLFFKGGSYS